ncbi:YgaP-like transmembrane domain [Phreatobacter stygius]|uniref:DUF2892 domain-containing protein n=1 Tax=Phreatobacter stygius TaxID=1940610 RepID=A0A4D7B8H5_9HYPH|nr:YgaP-like transmembrane domain [Phreatobacter stygius]QCI66578.1 DUF2892 domain-containing protein [Phreatobacter stygius]
MVFYRKNIGGFQQIARIALGLAGAGAALALMAPPLSLAGAAAGAMFALTGIVGYCPMCAVAGVGRRDGRGA